MLSKIEAGIAIVIARMGEPFREPIWSLRRDPGFFEYAARQ
jgi:hypothetical protein